jgi:hypothetical protein
MAKRHVTDPTTTTNACCSLQITDLPHDVLLLVSEELHPYMRVRLSLVNRLFLALERSRGEQKVEWRYREPCEYDEAAALNMAGYKVEKLGKIWYVLRKEIVKLCFLDKALQYPAFYSFGLRPRVAYRVGDNGEIMHAIPTTSRPPDPHSEFFITRFPILCVGCAAFLHVCLRFKNARK